MVVLRCERWFGIAVFSGQQFVIVPGFQQAVDHQDGTIAVAGVATQTDCMDVRP